MAKQTIKIYKITDNVYDRYRATTVGQRGIKRDVLEKKLSSLIKNRTFKKPTEVENRVIFYYGNFYMVTDIRDNIIFWIGVSDILNNNNLTNRDYAKLSKTYLSVGLNADGTDYAVK